MDEAFPGPVLLLPRDVRRRARLAQICAILDNFGWSPMAITIFVQRVVVPMRGGAADPEAIDAALLQAERVLATVEGLMDGERFLLGGAVSLADLHLVPNLNYFARNEDGRAALQRRLRLATWWDQIKQRPSVARTRPNLG